MKSQFNSKIEFQGVQIQNMSFSIEPKTLKKLVDFYHPNNKGEEMKYILFLKGQDEMYMNLQTSAFQGISQNSIQERLAWFGPNQVTPPFQFTFSQMIIKSLTQYTCMVWVLLFSLILFVLGIFLQYNGLKISYLEGLIGLILYLVNSILITIIEYGKYSNFKKIYTYTTDKIYCDVWRQNQKQQIDAEKVVVGDIVELGVGSVIPADGWIIQGELKVQEKYSYGTIVASKTTLKACVNHLERQANIKNKKYTIANKVKSQNPNVQYSPVVLGGSTIIEGEGRMLVLCVGKFSRKGEFELLLKNFNPDKKNSQLEIKMEQYTSQLFKYGLLGVLILIIGLIGKEIVSNLINPNQKLSDLLDFKRYQYITLSLNFLLYLIPQGCLLGLGAGLLIHKKLLEYSHDISIRKLINCQSMSYVEYICHEKESQKSYFRIREWWNNRGKIDMDEEATEDQQQLNPKKENEQEQRLFKKLNQVNQNYLKFFRKAMTVTSNNRDTKNERNQKSLKYGSFRNLDECFIHYSRRKSYISLDSVNEDQIIEQIPYDNIRKRSVVVTNCPQDIEIPIPKSSSNVLTPPQIERDSKYRISLKVSGSNKLLPKYNSSIRIQRKVIVYIRGKHETVLELCSYIMCQQTGKVQEITEQKAMEIKATIDSMLRRQLRAVVLAYKITTINQNAESCSQWDQENGYVLLAIIGINDTRSTLDFELLTKMKQLNINLMIASTNSMEKSISAANQIGIIKTDESSILINGSDFLHIVGGIICSQCKKPICVCEHGNDFHKIKNIDEFERILKHLDVLANAQAFHKYTLIVGLKNKNICSAVTGKKIIDIPSMLQSEVSLFLRDSQPQSLNRPLSQVQQSAFEIEIPDNSVATLFNLIKESRICFKFIRKFIKLATCSCMVSMIYLLTSLILFKEDFGLKLVHIFWVQIFVMFFLALAMIFDYETDNNETFPIMNEDIKNYRKSESLIDSEGWKQIATYSLTQLIILFTVTLLGPLFIPEKSDDIDQLIGDDWMAKYADETKSSICSGLPFSIQGSNWNYKQTFQQYQIFSRHQTIIFALFSKMQIFNYFNFRQFNMKEVNIFKNFKIFSIFIVLVLIFGNLIFIEIIGDYGGLYQNGLTFEQWIIIFGIAMALWVVGILARLFPNMKKEDNEYKIRWQNKAYNLAVKSVAPKNEFSQFEVDQYFQLRPQIFSTNKID